MSTGKIAEHRILDDLRAVATRVDGVLTERQYAERGEFGVTTIRRRFGSWNAAKEAAGLETVDSETIPEPKLLVDLRRVADEVDGPLSERTYAERGEFGVTTYRRRFGSWSAAKRAAGLHGDALDEDDLVADLQRVADTVTGQYVTASDYREHGRYRLAAFPDDPAFWERAIGEVGLAITPLRHKFAADA